MVNKVMNEQQLAAFFAQQGLRVAQTASSYWCEAQTFCYQNVPYHRPIAPRSDEIDKLFYGRLALIIRYNSWEAADTVPGYIWIADDRNYDIHSLGGKSRNQTRRGLEKNLIEEMDFDSLSHQGWPMLEETAARQGRIPDFTPSHWRRYCLAAKNFQDFEAWGAFSGNRLAAFLAGVRVGDYYYILQQASASMHLGAYPNNALIFTVTQRKLADPEVSVVSYGLDSLEETPGLQKFKRDMGYKLLVYHQKILINPWLRWMKSSRFKAFLRSSRLLFPRNNYLRKAEAVLNKLAV